MESNLSPYPRFALFFLAVCTLLCLSGCAATRLRTDYAGYENAYADSSNREMLLNLARLNHHDPTFFFKLGQITTQYKMAASLNGNGSKVTQGTASGSNIVGGGATNLSFEKDPTFQFIPVNDDATAQLLMKPIPPETFYALYQQGWRVDQLFRIMVDRIEFRGPNGNWDVIRNLPASENPIEFTQFLRISALSFELQKRGFLLLRPHKEFESLAQGLKFTTAPNATDLLNAQAKSLMYRKETDGWELGQEKVTAQFELNGVNGASPPPQILQDMPELNRGGIGGVTALQAMLVILQKGFTIQPAISSTDTGKEEAIGSAHLVMRSMIGVLTAAAQEQDGYADLLNSHPVVNGVKFEDLVPPVEQRPLLRLTWNSEESVIDPLVQLMYGTRQFMITDKSDPKTPEDMSWNRDVFRLISQIAAQVTVDISKFPLPIILQ